MATMSSGSTKPRKESERDRTRPPAFAIESSYPPSRGKESWRHARGSARESGGTSMAWATQYNLGRGQKAATAAATPNGRAEPERACARARSIAAHELASLAVPPARVLSAGRALRAVRAPARRFVQCAHRGSLGGGASLLGDPHYKARPRGEPDPSTSLAHQCQCTTGRQPADRRCALCGEARERAAEPPRPPAGHTVRIRARPRAMPLVKERVSESWRTARIGHE
jgi:hypothetical protein